MIKQIATMLIAICGSQVSALPLDELRQFVLSPQRMTIPNPFVFAAYFNPADPARSSSSFLTQNRLTGSCAVMDVRTRTSAFVLSEVAFPPMGYVAYSTTDAGRLSEDFSTLCDIRSFTNFGYDRSTTMFINMPVRYPFGPVPGYYPNLNESKERPFVDDDHILLAGGPKIR